MKALDTNVLVRFLVQDDKKQSQKVNQLFSQSEITKQPLFVTLLVMLELIWVLEAVYKVSRKEILLSISEMLCMPSLEFEKQQVLRSFVNVAQKSRFDLSDILIAEAGFELGCEKTLTFDKKAVKFELFEIV